MLYAIRPACPVNRRRCNKINNGGLIRQRRFQESAPFGVLPYGIHVLPAYAYMLRLHVCTYIIIKIKRTKLLSEIGVTSGKDAALAKALHG